MKLSSTCYSSSRRLFNFIGFAFLLLIFSACYETPENQSSQNNNQQLQDQPESKVKIETIALPELGIPHSNIKVKADPSYSYALYLPDSFSREDTIPMLIAFDPHGDGLKPISEYRKLANELNMLIIGSYDSKNGIPIGTTENIAKKLLEEAVQQYGGGKNPIIFLGFSGGARVAAYNKTLLEEVDGIIACGAGIPENITPAAINCPYYGIAGKEDFNYLELVKLNRLLDQTPAPNWFEAFEGGHEWPAPSVMKSALEWMKLRLISLKKYPFDKQLFTYHSKALEQEMGSLKAQGKIYALILHIQKIGSWMHGFEQPDQAQKWFDQYKEDERFVEGIKAQEKFEQKEGIERMKYGEAIKNNEMAYWEGEVKMLNSKSGNKEQDFLNQRLLNYLSITCFVYSKQLLAENRLNEARQFLLLYKLVDPKNPDQRFFNAIYNIRIEDLEGAITELEEAIRLGFADYERLMAQNDFTILNSDPRFEAILRNFESK